MGKRKHSSDDSSSEEEKKPTVKQESESSSSSDGGDGEWNVKQTKSKGKKKTKSKSKSKETKVKIEEEREEGEVDDDEDDGNSEDDPEEFNDGYDENLMGDEADKHRLAEMTEKEREQELFNRGEKREVLRTRFEIEKKLRAQKKKEQQKKTMKDFSESTLRSNERRRNMEDKRKQKDTLKALKEQREKKKQKQQKLRAQDVYSSSDSESDDEDEKKKKSSSSSSSSSSNSDSDSERGEKRGKRSDRRNDDYDARESDDDKKDDKYEISLADLNCIRISRRRIELWCHAPFFDKTILNSFVKIGIGNSQGKQVYRVAQVVEVSEGPKIYSLDFPKNSIKTNKQIKVRHGKEDRVFRLEFVSNQAFDETEFLAWKERINKDKLNFPKRSEVELKKKDFENAETYQYKDVDINVMLIEKEKFNKTPKNYAMRKTQLMKLKEQAENASDAIEVQRIQDELDTLEERAKELDKNRTHSIAAISYINERNRLRNIADTEKAIIAAREAREREGTTEEDDPFRRRNCRPTLVHKFNKHTSETNTPIKTEDGLISSLATPEANGLIGDVKPVVAIPIKIEKTPASPPRTNKDDLFTAHDFDIQIDFEIGAGGNIGHSHNHSSFSSQAVANVVTPAKAPNRRSLNLEEYKKKKGLI